MNSIKLIQAVTAFLVLSIPTCKASSFDALNTDLVDKSKSNQAKTLPDITYKVRPDYKLNNAREDRSTKDLMTGKVSLMFMPGVGTPTCSTKHCPDVIHFVDANKDELKRRGIQFGVVVPDNCDSAADWFARLGGRSKDGKEDIILIADSFRQLIEPFGLMQRSKDLGFITGRALVHIENGKILDIIKEADNAKTENTSSAAAMGYWDKKDKILSSPTIDHKSN